MTTNDKVDNTALEDEIPVVVITGRTDHDQRTSVVLGRAPRRRRLSKNVDEHDMELPTLSRFIIAHSKDWSCEQSGQLVILPGSSSMFESSGILFRKAPINSTIKTHVDT